MLGDPLRCVISVTFCRAAMTSKRALFPPEDIPSFSPAKTAQCPPVTYLKSGVRGHHSDSRKLNSADQSELEFMTFLRTLLCGEEVGSGPTAHGQSRVDVGLCVTAASVSAPSLAQTAAGAAHRLKRSWTFCANSFLGSFKGCCRCKRQTFFFFFLHS